ncbi:hypothetical protein ACIHFE_30110 [Streptomyces sp. NPDC052396]|uniref:hypothetical protein n=1 Tax=Streptomyces sp. NPDC052396 TaxID=3365689 RepID=UPI0037D60552
MGGAKPGAIGLAKAILLAVAGCWMLVAGLLGLAGSIFAFSPLVMLLTFPSFMLSGIALFQGWHHPRLAGWLIAWAMWTPSAVFAFFTLLFFREDSLTLCLGGIAAALGTLGALIAVWGCSIQNRMRHLP